MSGDEPEEIQTIKYSIKEAQNLIDDVNSPLAEARCVMGLMYALKKVAKS